MKTLLISCVLASGVFVAAVAGQAPAQPKPTAPPQTAKPATPPAGQPAPGAPAPTVRRAPAPATGRGGMAITVTTPAGATLPGIQVAVSGATDRTGTTNDSGQLNFPGMQVGNYRVRFSGDGMITLERDVTIVRGQVLQVDVALNAAPKPPPPAPAPAPTPVVAAPPKSVTGPTGQPQALSLVALAEREMISGRDARRDTLVSCSGNTRSMLVQLNQPQAERVYEDAEALYYVIAGQGTVTIGGAKPQQIEAGGYVALPRGASHTITRRGNRPLIMLGILSGEACEMPK